MKRKVIYALLATLISFGLWMYVVTVVNPEWEDTFYNIPVVLENEEVLLDRGLMLISEEAPKVTLRLSGNRADMSKLNSSNITLKANLANIYSAGEQSLTYSIVYPGDVPNNAFQILSQTPQQIVLTVTEWKSKDVDVQVEFTGAVSEQYIAFKDKATLDYEKITLTGPSEVIDRIAVAKVSVNLDGQTDTISQLFDYVLCDADGNQVESEWITPNAEQVMYTLKIQQWKDIALRLDVIDGGGIKREDCNIVASTNTIRVSGSEKLLADLEYVVLGQIKLGEITGDLSTTYDIVLPEGITNLSEKNTVGVTVDIPENLELRPFTITNIVPANVPTGMKASISITEKVVQIRGEAQWLDALTPQQLMIHVDCTGATLGDGTYPVIVTVTDPGLAGLVGAMDTEGILVTITAE